MVTKIKKSTVSVTSGTNIIAKDVRTNSSELKTLVIAEKPSVARDMVAALKDLDSFSKEEGYFEGEKYIISHAVGHLLTIAEPHEMSEKFKSWSLKNLPIIPDEFVLKPIANSEKQLKVLAKLLKRPNVNHIVNACDAGREGELIFRYIIDYVLGGTEVVKANGKTLSRLWLQSMTQTSIKKSFNELRSDEELYPLRDAAMSRSEADWLVGINASRALTSYNSQYGGFVLTPCGRVQTPTLSLLVKREKEIESFKPQDYWVLMGSFMNGESVYEGKWFNEEYDSKSSDRDEKADRIFDEKQADKIIKSCTGKVAVVEEKSKEALENCQLLYDLTSIQREANNMFGFSAKMTLGTLQSLYEKHKLLTYPRTDSRYLPEDYVSNTFEVFNKLASYDLDQKLSEYAAEALKKDYIKKTGRVYNNARISDHHAIIPTGEKPKKLDEPAQKIFNLVVKRYLAIFFPPAKFLKTTRISRIDKDAFKTEGKVMLEMGWKVIYGYNENDKVIAPLNNKIDTVLKEIEKIQSVTKPPPRYNEASLLVAMESAGKTIDNEVLKEAMKERGLGTPATRAAIIEKLVSDKYVVKQDRELLPTAKSFDLFELLYAMDLTNMSSAELTGNWEHKLAEIEKGKLPRKEFMDEITDVTVGLVGTIKNYDEKITKKLADFSPINGKKYYEYLSRYVSEDGEIAIRKIIGGRRLKPHEVETLLRERKLGPFEDFRSKRGNLFPASLVLDEQNKVKFVFMNQQQESMEDLKDAEEVGKSYLDGSTVYKTMNNYVSESFIEKKPLGIKVSRILLGKEISTNSMQKMIAGEKTELITGFRSVRTKRLFDAFLEIDGEAKVRFSFPERKTKAGAKRGGKVTAGTEEEATTKEATKSSKPKKVKTNTKAKTAEVTETKRVSVIKEDTKAKARKSG